MFTEIQLPNYYGLLVSMPKGKRNREMCRLTTGIRS